MAREILRAKEGMVLTNGEIYGKTIYLAENADKSAFKEITKEEYEKVLEQEASRSEDLYR